VFCFRDKVSGTSLVTKLPREITDYLVANSHDPTTLRHFTERRLRPLTMLRDGQEQIAQFNKMLADANDCAAT